MNKVYLAGSMEFVSLDEMKGWRDYVTQKLALREIETLDPTRRVAMHLNGEPHSANTSSRIVKQDYQDISKSSVIFADLRDSTSGRKWGTMCELAHSHTKNKIIIVVLDPGQYTHPFVAHFATEIYYSLDDAIEATYTYYE